MDLRIGMEEVNKLVNASPRLVSSRPRRLNIEKRIQKVRIQLRSEINQTMQPWAFLLDECVRFYIYFSELQWTVKFDKARSTFAMEIGRLRSLSISIRELVHLGQESAAYALARVFLDDLELTGVIIIDPDFALKYMNEDEDHDVEKFWKQNIGYGRIYPKYNAFLTASGWSNSNSTSEIKLHKELKNILSGHVHPSPASTFRGLAYPSWVYPGKFAIKSLGHLTIHIHQLCLMIAQQTQNVSACIINLMIKEKPPFVLSNYRRGSVLQNVLASAFVLQSLLSSYEDDLQAEYE